LDKVIVTRLYLLMEEEDKVYHHEKMKMLMQKMYSPNLKVDTPEDIVATILEYHPNLFGEFNNKPEMYHTYADLVLSLIKNKVADDKKNGQLKEHLRHNILLIRTFIKYNSSNELLIMNLQHVITICAQVLNSMVPYNTKSERQLIAELYKIIFPVVNEGLRIIILESIFIDRMYTLISRHYTEPDESEECKVYIDYAVYKTNMINKFMRDKPENNQNMTYETLVKFVDNLNLHDMKEKMNNKYK